ncbi:Transcription initiation factor TFIID subunit 13, partial [Mucuna pruriens]
MYYLSRQSKAIDSCPFFDLAKVLANGSLSCIIIESDMLVLLQLQSRTLTHCIGRSKNIFQHWTITMSNSSAGTSSKPRAASSQPSETSSKRKRGVFQKELQHMMYGFGDDPNPLPESVALMEDIVVEYVTELVHKAQDIGSQRGKLSVEDFLYLIRKDLPKLNRCTELLSMNEELKQARKVFESDEEKLRKVFEVDESVEG